MPAGLDLEFEGLSEIGDNGAAHFSDTISGSEIVLDWGTGAEIYRDVVASSTTRSDTSTPRNVDALFDSLRDSVVEAQDSGGTGVEKGNNYRPYPGLPGTAVVAVHPNMLMGEPIKVCNRATRDDFGDKKTYDKFRQALSDAMDAWNEALHMAGSATTGTPHKVFETTEICPTFSSVVHVYRDVNSGRCGPKALGCATTLKSGHRPPTIGGGEPRHFRIIVKLADEYHDSFKTILIHELGHFLGLGDYGRELGKKDADCPAEADKSVMTDPEEVNTNGVNPTTSYKPYVCGSAGLTTRDESDVHAIYHPDAVRGPYLKNEGGWRIAGRMPLGAEGGLEYSAYRMVVWQRLLGSAAGAAYSYVNAYDMESSELSGAVDISLGSAFDATGWEFLVAGATRGDWKRRTTDGGGSLVKWVAHSDVLSGELGGASWALSESWTLGDPVRLAGPPRAPTRVAASVDGPVVTVSWSEVGGAASYKVYWSTVDFADPALAQGSVEVSGDATSAPIPGLLAGQEYVFHVEATSERYDSRLAPHASALSAGARATPGLATPAELEARSVTRSSFLAGWGGVLGADSYWVRLDGGTAIEAGLTTAHKFDGLIAGTGYEFEVQAAKGTLRSKWSDTFAVTTLVPAVTPPVSAPAVPVIDTTRTAATSSSITIHWTTVADAAGLSFKVRHRVKPTAGTMVVWTAAGVAAQSGDHHVFSSLAAATTYEVQVRALRGTAQSAWSTTAEVTTTAAPITPPVTGPASPASVQVSTTADSATLTWTAVTGASGYRVRLGATGEGTYKAGASTASHTFRSLSADTSYTFGVRTVTATGSSSWVARTARTDPAAPASVQVSTTADSATLTWTAVTGASGYRVRQGATGEGTYKAGASTRSHTFRSLSADTSYTFGVRTVTATGSSSWVARTARTDPAAPTNVQVSTTANSATLTWTAVGGASGYRVRQGTTGEGIYKAGASSTSHTFGGLDANTSYMLGVKAVNDHGESNWMTVNAITDAAPVVVTPPTQLSGRSGIQRMTPTSVGGWTLNLTFFLDGHGEIEPEFRFTKLDDLETTWQYTSPVSATIGGQKRALGRVAYRKTTATGDRIEIGFKPSGGSLIRPRLRGVNYSNMVLWYTYKTSEITFTLPDQSRARADSDAAYAGRLAGGLAPGEEICTTCDAGVADLEPMGDTEPPPKDT